MSGDWISWAQTKASHYIVVSGFDPDGLECYRTRCGKRVYASETRVAGELRCRKCSTPRGKILPPVPPLVGTWSGVREFDLTDTEEL